MNELENLKVEMTKYVFENLKTGHEKRDILSDVYNLELIVKLIEALNGTK